MAIRSATGKAKSWWWRAPTSTSVSGSAAKAFRTTEYLKLTETFERPEYDTLRYIATIDDPGAYTKPWSGGWAIPWNPNDEMYEYVCQENNRDAKHMYRGEQ